MRLKIRGNSIAMHLLLSLDASVDIASTVFASPYEWSRRIWCGKYSSYKSAVYRLVKLGLLEIVEDRNNKLLSLTPEGRVQVFVAKCRVPHTKPWDGEWRVIFFDIPIKNNSERHQLRKLLLKNGFKKMQASVYISPWPLNREAIEYLKKTGLIEYIRVGRLVELDDDKDLRKKFKIS